MLRRFGRALGTSLVWALIGAVALVGSLVWHLDSAGGRRVLCETLQEAVNAEITGTLHAECTEISLRRVRLENVSVILDEPVLTVAALEVEPVLSEVLRGRWRLARISVDTPNVDLRDPDRFEAAFMPTDPSPPNDDPITLPRVRADQIEIATGEVRLPDQWVVRLALDSPVELGPGIRAPIESLRLDASRDEIEFATLALEGFLETGDPSSFVVRVESGTSELEGRLEFDWGERLDSGPVRWRIPELRARIRPETLEAPVIREWTGGIGLLEPLDMRISGDGTFDAVRAEGAIGTAAGEATIRVSWTNRLLEASVATDGLRLAELLDGLPTETVSGSVDASLRDAIHLAVDGRDLQYGDYGAPALSVVARLLPEALAIDSVSIPHLEQGGHLDIDGNIGFDGDVELHVDVDLPQLARDANVRSVARGLRSGVRGDFDLRLVDGEIEAIGSVTARHFAYRGLHAESLRVAGTVHGELSSPTLDVTVAGRSLRRGPSGDQMGLRSVQLVARGRGRRYSLRGTGVDLRGRPLGVDVRARQEGERIRLAGGANGSIGWGSPYRLQFVRVDVVGDRRVVFDGFHLTAEGIDARATGTLGLVGQSDLHVQAIELDLARLDERFELGRELRGSSTLSVRLRGTRRQPRVELDGLVSGFSIHGVPAGTVEVAAKVEQDEQDEQHASVRLDVVSESELGRVEVHGSARLPGRDPTRGWDRAVFDTALTAREFEIGSHIGAFTEHVIEGVLGARVHLAGRLEAPVVNGTAAVRDLVVDGGPPMQVGILSSMERGLASAEIAVRDEVGVLAKLHAATSGLGPQIDTLDELLDTPFSLSLDMPRRRLDQLPPPLFVDEPLFVTARATLARGMRGRVTLRAQHRPETECPDGLPSELELRADLEDEVLRVALTGGEEGETRLTARTQIPAPLRTWLRDGFPETLPVLAVDAQARGLRLAALPRACRFATGHVALDLRAERVFGERPAVQIGGRIDALSVSSTLPVDVTFDGRVESREFRMSVNADAEGHRALRANIQVPIRWEGTEVALRERPWEGRVRLDRMPVTPLLALVPNVAQPRGRIDGDLQLAGVGTDIALRGGLELLGVSAIIQRPLVRLDDLRGKLRMTDAGLQLEDVRYRDREGTVVVDGSVDLDGMNPTAAQLTARLRRMPFRVEGVVFATIDALANLRASFSEDGNQLDVRLREVDVKLPEEAGRRVQALDQHREVVFVDEIGFDAARAAAASPPSEVEHEVTPGPAVPTRVDVRARPFWVRREDFSIQLAARLTVFSEERVRLTGEVDVRRGFIELLGRNFDFVPGEIRFAGGADVDPVLDLEAVHALRSGETVTVRITGNLSRPVLSFSTTVPGVESEREVVQLLVQGRTSGGDVTTAQEQASSALAGLMAGFLSTLTRRELGAYVPVFRFEAEGANTARVRAGFSADDIIPEFLTGVVVGAYVEGFVGTDQDDGGTQRTTGGVLIELLHPRHIVTRSTWEEPNNWSLDFTWEPL